MTSNPTGLFDLWAECDACGIRLTQAGEGLEIDAPYSALTPEILDRLKAHKAGLLAMVRCATEAVPAEPAMAVCRCGSTICRDVPIHGGQSVRRDCGHCERFLEFANWYGVNTGQNGQH